MSRYYVETPKEGHGSSRSLNATSKQHAYETSTRAEVTINDRRQEGNQAILTMKSHKDVALADEICAFLNSR